ncbi:hypothetical protein JOC34_000376 [Virgibacillus halotolerans]|uniref:hypothetical protein n=1 Tax=Virgibacillus halotolerans TaxID=1071053 RepID=UPI00196212C1|nr:hypothetical protein [Virgibacillus halotolerans]MBM7598019.1 hypothetical protein [Virgibacillus halotolerans]
MSNAVWIGADGLTEDIKDDWGMTAKDLAELEERVANENRIISDYIYSFIHPAQLPQWLENIILDHDYSPEDLDFMTEELGKYKRL